MNKKQDNQYPLITIGICCYKSPDTAGRAVESALAQDYPNFEIVVVDDGSKDGTADVVAETIKGHDNARLIVHETNKTFPGALNTVIAEAKGEFIAIFDDDDQSRPDRIRVQQRTITDYEAKTGAALVACWGSGVRKYPNGYDVHFQGVGSREKNPVGTEMIDYLLYFGKKEGVFYGGGTPSCSLMTRKSTYEAVGLYDTDMFRSEDTDFSCRLALKGGHFIGCSEEVVVQYSTGGAEKRAEVMYDSYVIVMNKYQDYLKSKNRYTYAMLWNRLRLHHFGRRPFKALGVLAVLFFRHPVLTWTHFWASAPKRLIHEWKMSKKAKVHS